MKPTSASARTAAIIPKSFIGETPEISELGVIGSVVGNEKCFGAVKGKVQPGPMTFFRASTDDRLGTIKAYVGEGEFTDDPFPMDGGIAVTKVARLRPLLGFIARNGFEHHVAMVRGHHAEAVHEAITRYMNWPIYRHEPEPSRDGFGSPFSAGEAMDLRSESQEAKAAKRLVAGIRSRARAIRMHALNMVFEARQGHPGGDMSVDRHSGDALFRRAARRSESAPRARSGPADPQQGACERRPLFDSGGGGIHSRRGAFDLHEAAFDAQRPSKPKLRCLASKPTRVRSATDFRSPSASPWPARSTKPTYRVFVITGDGELQEGSNWEAAMAPGHHKLANLTLIIDRNTLQQGARVAETNDVEPLADKFRAFRWDVVEVDGHDPGSLLDAFAPQRRSDKATMRDRPYHQGQGRLVHGRSGRVASRRSHPGPT